MKTYHILYNNVAGKHEAGTDACVNLVKKLGDVRMVDVQTLESHKKFLSEVPEDDAIVICGGDGTLNHYINGLLGVKYSNQVLYYPGGSGNDFYHCVHGDVKPELVDITHIIKDLPTATIKGKEYAFTNGIGCGIDGFCCEYAQKQREKGRIKINYTALALYGVFFKYKPTGITVTVDGVDHRFEGAWLASVMNGKYFGGGMIPTPGQIRNSGELSVMIAHDLSKLKILVLFPTLFTGKHVKFEKNITILRGKEITVKYDEPRPLQIDGEVISGVTDFVSRAYSEE